MERFRLSIAIVTAIILAILGFILAIIVPLPPPTTPIQSRVLYVLVGLFLASLIFSRLTAWIIRTSTDVGRRLLRLLVMRMVHETINQLSHITSSGMMLGKSLGFPLSERKATERISNPIILDTSALIDGRILDVAKSGFVSGLILVPDFVLRELQQVADSADALKRERGRRGFVIIEQIKTVDGVKVVVWDKQVSGKNVDDKLIHLGKALKGKVLTVDYNLKRVADVSGVKVLNINDLTNALKALPIPGEELSIKIVHLGKDRDQGVGYLDDGTMVIVKEGGEELGAEVQIKVSKILQGSAGRMIFGEINSKNGVDNRS